MRAIGVLVDRGVPQDRILFACVMAAQQGIAALRAAYPGVCLVAGEIDDGIDDEKFIIPGCGDFSERYFGTDV